MKGTYTVLLPILSESQTSASLKLLSQVALGIKAEIGSNFAVGVGRINKKVLRSVYFLL